LVFALLSSASPASAAQAGPAAAAGAESLPPEARAAAAAVDAFHAALRSGDTAAALALLDEEALIFEDGGVERSKAEYASHHLSADAAFSKAVRSVRTGRRGGGAGDMAWIASEARVTGSFNGQAVDRAITETMALVRAGGQWRIAHIHWSSGVPSE
jgi:ketosteroid isomerase-like protein